MYVIFLLEIKEELVDAVRSSGVRACECNAHTCMYVTSQIWFYNSFYQLFYHDNLVKFLIL